MENKVKEYYYECDTGRGGKKLRQSSLKTSFMKTSPEMKTGDTNKNISIATPTVGPGVVNKPGAGINSSVDVTGKVEAERMLD